MKITLVTQKSLVTLARNQIGVSSRVKEKVRKYNQVATTSECLAEETYATLLHLPLLFKNTGQRSQSVAELEPDTRSAWGAYIFPSGLEPLFTKQRLLLWKEVFSICQT